MTWLQNADGDYVRVDDLSQILAGGSGTTWWVYPGSTSATRFNCGPYTSKAAAQDAIRKLVKGVDPSTLV